MVEGTHFTARVLDQGFPVNFSSILRQPDPEIELTRTLTLLAFTQAGRCLRKNLYFEMEPDFQRYVSGSDAAPAVALP